MPWSLRYALDLEYHRTPFVAPFFKLNGHHMCIQMDQTYFWLHFSFTFVGVHLINLHLSLNQGSDWSSPKIGYFQMGSKYKKAIFDDPLKNAIYGWRSKAQESRKIRQMKSSQELKDNHLGHEQSTESNSELVDEGHLIALDNAMPMPNTAAKCSRTGSQDCDIEVGLGLQTVKEPLSPTYSQEDRNETTFFHGKGKLQLDYSLPLPLPLELTKDNNLLLDSPSPWELTKRDNLLLDSTSLSHKHSHTLDIVGPNVEFSTTVNPIFTTWRGVPCGERGC